MAVLQQYWMVLFLLAAGQGLFLSFRLFTAVKNSPALLYLSWLIGLFSISLVYYVAFWTQITATISPFWGLILTLPTLFGPLILAYGQSLRGKKFDFDLHAVPFAAHLIYLFLYYAEVSSGIIIPGVSSLGLGVFTFIQNTSLVMYSSISVYQSIKFKEAFSKGHRLLTWSFTGFSVSHLMYYLLVNTANFQPLHDYFISFFMSVFMFAVGYVSLHPLNLAKTKQHRNAKLPAQLMASYRKSLLVYMQSHKPFLEGDLKIKDVADHLGTTVHHISEVLNSEIGMSYSEFINKYRIEEAVNLMDSDLGIMEIGYRSGFNNKTSFSQTFKKHTGLTPSQFRREYAKNASGKLHNHSVR